MIQNTFFPLVVPFERFVNLAVNLFQSLDSFPLFIHSNGRHSIVFFRERREKKSLFPQFVCCIILLHIIIYY